MRLMYWMVSLIENVELAQSCACTTTYYVLMKENIAAIPVEYI